MRRYGALLRGALTHATKIRQAAPLLKTPGGKPVERLFLYHVRKAAGTSLRRYFTALAAEKKLACDIVEGRSLDHDRGFAQPQPTAHIICLRDPLARLKSSYRFEGRWAQMDEDCRPETAKPFSDWVADTRRNEDLDWLWTCSEHYYVKSLIGYPRFGGDGIGCAEFELAKRRLREFEIVLVTEWLSSPQTENYLRRGFSFDMPVPHDRYPSPKRPGETDEELFDAPTIAWLEQANRFDFELHEEAKRIFQERAGTQPHQ